eukprot:3810452-Karenia_brevis.AAC.1
MDAETAHFENATASKIAILARTGGVPHALLEHGLRLLAEVCWTSVESERPHASIAMVLRHHPEAELESCIARATIHQSRA